MKSWKTTIGGSLETLGTGIRDLSTISAVVQFNGSGNIATLNLWLILSGSILCMVGKFFSSLFAADASEVQKQFAAQANDIAQVKGDTASVTRTVENLPKNP